MRRLLFRRLLASLLVALGLLAGSVRPASASLERAPALAESAYAVGVRQLSFTRSGRSLPTKVWYPAAGTPGSSPVSNAAIADGRFPVVLFSHGLGANANTYVALTVPLAARGFVVAAPDYPNTKTGSSTSLTDVLNGSQSLDASYVISEILKLNDQSTDRFFQHLDSARGVGAAGHSAGGMTTQGMLGLKKDSRVTAAAILSGRSVGTPRGVSANVLFIHGSRDYIVSYTSGRRAYDAIPWTKAFLTLVGQGHSSYIRSTGTGYQQASKTLNNWMLWTLYGDTAARERLEADATSTGTRWEAIFR